MRMRLLLLLSLLGWVSYVYGADKKSPYYIVVNADIELEAIDRYTLSNIYLGKQTLWSGESRIYPAMLSENKKAMRQFIEKTLNKSVTQYRSYWKRRLFSGGGTVPKTFRKTRGLLLFVARNSGAIGVVDKKIEMEGVKYIPIEKVIGK